jgi:hypothetical protein
VLLELLVDREVKARHWVVVKLARVPLAQVFLVDLLQPAYTAEGFPTRIRSSATGIVEGSRILLQYHHSYS